MTTEHCAHCGDSCGDDHRAPHTLPQTLHTDERGAWWRPGCCPACNLSAQLADRLDAERKRITSAYPRSSYPLSVGGYVEGLDFAAEAVADV